jgi:hypothetical protein
MNVLPGYRLLEPELRAILDEADTPGKRRQLARTVGRLAVDRTGVADPRLTAALACLESGAYGDSPDRVALEALTQELDEVGWRLQERVDAGAASEEEYVKAFTKARATNSVWCALDPDALVAAVEATYEARAALREDRNALRTAMEQSLNGRVDVQ